MKKVLLGLVGLIFSTQAFAQQIIRTTTIQPSHNSGDDLGAYSVEVKLEKTQSGSGVLDSSEYIETVADEPCNMTPVYYCSNRVDINQDVTITYTLKDQNGNAVARKTKNSSIIATHSAEVEKDTKCVSPFPQKGNIAVYHIADFVDFQLNKDSVLSVGAAFDGSIERDQNNFIFTANEKSLKELRWFFNSKDFSRRGNAQLIDPANPPVHEEVDWDNY